MRSSAEVVAPSGRQHAIAFEDQRAVAVEVGGGLRCYQAGGLEIVDGYGEEDLCTAARGQLLIPWPNRIRDGRYTFDGKDHQLALSEPEQLNAIHGLVRWLGWTALERGPARVVLGLRLHPQPGYPFRLDLTAAYELGPGGLRVTLGATNAGAGTAPFAAGQHPYLRVGTALIDDAVIQVPGHTYRPSDERQIPVGRAGVAGTQFDLRDRRRLGPVCIDHSFGDFDRDQEGRAWIVMAAPDGRAEVRAWFDPGFQHVMLFTGDDLGPRARRGLGLEPMTCPPNGLQTGEDVVVLPPGGSWEGSWGLVPGGTAADP